MGAASPRGDPSNTSAGSTASPSEVLGSLCCAVAAVCFPAAGKRGGKKVKKAQFGMEIPSPAMRGVLGWVWGGAPARGVLGAGERSRAGGQVLRLSVRHGRNRSSAPARNIIRQKPAEKNLGP